VIWDSSGFGRKGFSARLPKGSRGAEEVAVAGPGAAEPSIFVNVIPQMGQLPGLSEMMNGCMPQVYLSAVIAALSPPA